MKKLFLFFLFSLIFKFTFAQEAAVPTLLFPQSPLLEGTGRIGAALPMEDAGGFYYNPAQLGYFATKNNFAVSFTPGKLNWFPQLSSNVFLQMYSAAAGYNFYNPSGGIPLSIGIGYTRNKLSYGAIESNEIYDSFDSYSLGIGYNYYVLFNLGFSFKTFHSVLTYLPTPQGGVKPVEAKSTAVDFGAMIIAPVSKLLFNDAKFNLDKDSFVKPLMNFTLGYAETNIGKEIFYTDAAQKDPIPRTARLGYTFDFGFDLFIKGIKLNALDYSFTAEAEDILIKQDIPNIQYQGPFGDISIGKNLISLEGNENVTLHRGHIFRVFETFIFTSGRITGSGYADVKSYTHGFSSEGVTKLLSIVINNPVITFISNHIILQYYDANVFEDSKLNTNLSEFSISAKNVTL